MTLRPVAPPDLDVHFEQQRDAEANALAAVAARDRPAFDAHWQRILADPDTVVRTIDADGEPVGSAVSFVRDGKRWVGYWIGREHWGRGIATHALGRLLEELPERPLHATVAAHNPASLRVLVKHGFRIVGRERDGDVELHELELDRSPLG